MAPSIYTGLILFTLLHLGMSYSIWGPKSEQEAILNATLDIFNSVNKNPKTSDINVESKLLASKLLSLFKRVQGIEVDFNKTLDDELSSRVAEVINIIVYWSHDLNLQKAEQEVSKNDRLFVNEYSWFLNNDLVSDKIKTMIRKALELDNEQSFENSKTMSSFFKLYLDKYEKKLENYQKFFKPRAKFLGELYKYNVKNEWNGFMMMTTAYKLKSLESNDDNYVKEFQRLREQLMNKLSMHETKYFEALAEVLYN